MTSDHHRRVLIVDDDSDVRDLLSTHLRQNSLTIDEAADGREAIELLRENTYAVIVLDLLLPLADGFEVLDAIRVDLPIPPVVLVVTGADRAVIEQLDPRRIHGIVRKPFDAQDVAAIVAACADIRGTGGFQTMAIATMMLFGSASVLGS